LKILSIDTSFSAVSVALTENSEVLANFFINAGLRHSITLMPMIDQLFKCSNERIEDIDLFAVSTGPGSFTGIRIGICTVQGMSLALDKPCVGISSLHSLAVSAMLSTKDIFGVIICAMDAKCQRVYSAVFENSKTGLTRKTNDCALTINELVEFIDTHEGKIFLIGDAAELCLSKIHNKNVALLNTSLNWRNFAIGIAKISENMFLEGKSMNINKIRPSYVCVPKVQRNKNIVKDV
jgi:tRNA threonylcarbamoyladenosine biosynthesis protein TsaB